MLTVLMWVGVFIGSLIVLLKAADFFIEFSEEISKVFAIPSFIVGATIVALGTSLPELVSSIVAVQNNSSEIVVSNVTGSNIANILLVVGFMAVAVSYKKLNFKLSQLDILSFVGSALLLAISVWDGYFSFIETSLCLVGIVIYVFFTIRNGREEQEEEEKHVLKWYVIPGWVASCVLIWLSATYNIEAIIKLSELLNIGKEIISLSVVAIGTSLPELFVSVTAIKKGKAEIAFGNILGSNIFNVFAVMGISSLFGQLTIPPIVVEISIPLMLLATFFYLGIIYYKKLRWQQGVFLLGLYLGFVLLIFR